jgi:hypothetical protein
VKVADAAFEELLKLLLADWELPVSPGEFPCALEKRKKMQKRKMGPIEECRCVGW